MAERANPSAVDRFDRMYREHFTAIYAYAFRRVASSEVSDVVQEVFACAWRVASQIPEPPEDRLWLYALAHRSVQHSQRGGLRRRRLQERLDVEAPVSRQEPGSNDELLARVAITVAHLRPQDKELLRLILWDGIDRRDVARILGCSPGAVDIRYHRIMRRLRSRLILAPSVERIGSGSFPAAEL